MGASEYELLKCEDCGKALGYVHVAVKTFPPKFWIRMVAGGPVERVEKTAFCEECFQKRVTNIKQRVQSKER